MAARGVDGVLGEIDQITSDYAAGRYFGALIAGSKLDDEMTARVVTAAGHHLESDYELGKVLKAVPVASLSGPAALGAYVEATGSIESDYELGRTLARVLSAGPQNQEVTKALLKRASTMDSDHELAELLLGLVATGTVKGDATVAYIDAIPTIESDYEKQRVLTAIAPALAGNPRMLAQSLRTCVDDRVGPQPERIPQAVPHGDDALRRAHRSVLRGGRVDRVGLQPAGSAGCGTGTELRP
jgi:hypothetical protein